MLSVVLLAALSRGVCGAEETSAADLVAPPESAGSENEVLAEIVPLPPSQRSLEQEKQPQKPARTPAPREKSKPIQSSSDEPHAWQRPAEPGYATVLSGTLSEDLELTPHMSPVLIRGALIVPESVKLTIHGGTVVDLRADPGAAKPAPNTPGTPDPAKSAVLWIWGTLETAGGTGAPAELLNQDQTEASLLLYGAHECRMDGLRLKGVTVAQNGGIARWTNCELIGPGAYAMAAGAALMTQSTFRKFGGVFATYDVAPWSLLIRKCLFESCREGVVLGSTPGDARLVIERNHFIATQGAHIRALPLKDGSVARAALPVAARGASEIEILIGENWYGSSIPEEIDMRIVDRRSDPAIHARLNTRPPAAQPYTHIGAGMKPAIIEATLKEQQSQQQKLIQAHLARQKAFLASRQVAVQHTEGAHP